MALLLHNYVIAAFKMKFQCYTEALSLVKWLALSLVKWLPSGNFSIESSEGWWCEAGACFSIVLFALWEALGSGHNKTTRWGPTLCRGRGAMQDTTHLISQMDKIYWP